MWKRFASAAAVLALACAASGAGLSKQSSLAELEGKWTLVKAEMGGKSLLDKAGQEIVIKDGKLTSDFKRMGKDPIDLTKALDPTKSPKIITLPVERRIVFAGIYEVTDSQLRIGGEAGRSGRVEANRPKSIDNSNVVLVFKRAQ
jgi:uncharacterized protein (TIGR03067 family)